MIGYQLAVLQYGEPRSGERVNIGVVALGDNHEAISRIQRSASSRVRGMYPGLSPDAFASIMRGVLASCKRGIEQHASFEVMLERMVPKTEPWFHWSQIQYGITDDLDRAVDGAYHDYIGRHEHP